LGDTLDNFSQVWGKGTLEENFVGQMGTYDQGAVMAYFRDFNGEAAGGDRAEQVVVELGVAAGFDPNHALNPTEALVEALKRVPADATPQEDWAPAANSLAYLYHSDRLAEVLPDHGGQFVILLTLTTAQPPGVLQFQLISGNGQNLGLPAN